MDKILYLHKNQNDEGFFEHHVVPTTEEGNLCNYCS